MGEEGGIVGTQEAGAGVLVHTETEISHSHFQARVPNKIRDCGTDTGIDLGWVIRRRVVFVVEADEEDAGDQGRRG